MSVSVAVILSFLLAHPAWSDRAFSSEQRESFLRPVAEAIAEASHSTREVAVLLALGMRESNFASAVVAGDCSALPKGQRCDAGKARGFAQLHESACRAAYQLIAGSPESIRAEARCAIGLLRGGQARCHSLEGAFAAYGTGNSCKWRGAADRVRTANRIERDLAEIQRRGDGAGGEVASE